MGKITRRGFSGKSTRFLTEAQLDYANAYVRELAEEQDVLASLRAATYCGPGSAGDQGVAVLEIHASETGFELISIAPQGRAS